MRPTPGHLTTHDEALAWLYAQTRAGGRRHPGRAAALLALLGLRPPANVVRVVGTNGKGSVSAMLAAGLSAAGHVTGRFLSPHVESFSERVAVDGLAVTPEQVLAFTRSARAALDEHPLPPDLRPSFFELTLALALEAFGRAGASHAVLEAGVGGASDATSAAVGDGLRLVVLTNVDLDHTETLGATVSAIAVEKAGAFAPGVPAVTGARGVALEAVAAVAARVGAPLHVDDGRDPLFDLPPAASDSARAAPTSAAPASVAPTSAGPASARPASGTWRDNARLAAAGLRLLGTDERAVGVALSGPGLPARGERFLLDGREVVLDGAHDPAAAARLGVDVGAGFVLLFGSLARKQGLATLERLEALAAAVVVTAAEPGDDLARFGAPGRELVADPAAALQRALDLTPVGGRLLAAGSLYLAGALRPLLHSRSA